MVVIVVKDDSKQWLQCWHYVKTLTAKNFCKWNPSQCSYVGCWVQSNNPFCSIIPRSLPQLVWIVKLKSIEQETKNAKFNEARPIHSAMFQQQAREMQQLVNWIQIEEN